ncbi:hypothetical protein VNO77_27674 [Canavalia gladiata]|uniref:Uncharacterized protein n=1 Tax=Canavalia gladiata TaxID=3824 RepID=A0AAN9KVQ4_CANGL
MQLIVLEGLVGLCISSHSYRARHFYRERKTPWYLPGVQPVRWTTGNNRASGSRTRTFRHEFWAREGLDKVMRKSNFEVAIHLLIIPKVILIQVFCSCSSEVEVSLQNMHCVRQVHDFLRAMQRWMSNPFLSSLTHELPFPMHDE